jgi:hypothetical protein
MSYPGPGAAGAACARLLPTPILRALPVRKAIEPVQYCYLIRFISEYACKCAEYVKTYTEYADIYAEYIMKYASYANGYTKYVI